MTKKWLAHGLGLLIVAACGSVESGGEFVSGRRALMSGDSAVALTYFDQLPRAIPITLPLLLRSERASGPIWVAPNISQASSSKPRVHWKERCPKSPTIQLPSFTSR